MRKSTKPPILKQTKSKTEATKPAAESEQVAKTHKYVLTNKKRGFENSSLVETNGHEVKSPVKDGSDAPSAKSKEETVPPVPAVRKKVRKNSTFLDHVNIIDVIPSDYLSNDEKESQVGSTRFFRRRSLGPIRTLSVLFVEEIRRESNNVQRCGTHSRESER